jgi:hypothetical protein
MIRRAREAEALAAVNRSRAESGHPPLTIEDYRDFQRWKRRNALSGAIVGGLFLSGILWLLGKGMYGVYTDIRQHRAVHDGAKAATKPLTCDEGRRAVARKWQLLSTIRVHLDDNDPIARNINAQNALDDRKEQLQDQFEVELICAHPPQPATEEDREPIRPPVGH